MHYASLNPYHKNNYFLSALIATIITCYKTHLYFPSLLLWFYSWIFSIIQHTANFDLSFFVLKKGKRTIALLTGMMYRIFVPKFIRNSDKVDQNSWIQIHEAFHDYVKINFAWTGNTVDEHSFKCIVTHWFFIVCIRWYRGSKNDAVEEQSRA